MTDNTRGTDLLHGPRQALTPSSLNAAKDGEGKVPNMSKTENAWQALRTGNERFVAGTPRSPDHTSPSRLAVAVDERPPVAVVFGCAESSATAEMVFDQDDGQVLVISTLGHATGDAVLGSLEYAVQILDVPLVVVLGHDHCCAVQSILAARHVVSTGMSLIQRSPVIAAKVHDGSCAVAFATYDSTDGHVHLHGSIGNIDELC
jgi:carbonic anhydrase